MIDPATDVLQAPTGRDLEALWERARLQTEALTFTELVELFDVDVVGGWGLPIKAGTVVLPAPSSFGWQASHVDLVLSESPQGGWAASPATIFESGATVALLSFPGAYTYGHWIIDVPARIEILRKYSDISNLKFVVPSPVKDWFLPFLAAHGIRQSQLIALGEGDKLSAKRVLLPGFKRVGDYLPSWPYKTSLERIRDYGAGLQASTEGESKIWVRHVPQTSANMRPLLSNSTELESALEALGFVVVCPATLSVEDQVAAFRSAKIIVGEDSSALHNAVWGRPTALIVLTAVERSNLLHLSMANLLGYECIFLDGVTRDELSFDVAPEIVLDALQRFI